MTLDLNDLRLDYVLMKCQIDNGFFMLEMVWEVVIALNLFKNLWCCGAALANIIEKKKN